MTFLECVVEGRRRDADGARRPEVGHDAHGLDVMEGLLGITFDGNGELAAMLMFAFGSRDAIASTRHGFQLLPEESGKAQRACPEWVHPDGIKELKRSSKWSH